MPKTITIHPAEERRSGVLNIDPIPLNQYARPFEDEIALRGKPILRGVYHDMAVIRTFESMLNDVKLKGEFAGIAYNHRGPAHLSIGQEASAVGQSLSLSAEDHLFGSHRSHGEILAKGLSAIAKMPESALETILRETNQGEILRIIDDGRTSDVRELAIDFLLYGALAEIFARETGFNLGMGGSMHAFFLPFGVFPNNAIVGGSADISVGAALYKKVNQRPGVVVCNIGDASAGCGPVWEALMFAAMDQFRDLWEAPYQGGLPFILNFVNNFYGMGGQPVGETMGFRVLARLGAGVNPENLHSERVDGYSPLAVADATERKVQVISEGRGPAMLDTLTYRYSGHSPSDASSYRDKSEVEAWQSVDSIRAYGRQLVEHDVATPDDLVAMQATIEQAIERAYRRAIDETVSTRISLLSPGNLLDETTFSNQVVMNLDPSRTPELNHPLAENARVIQLAGKNRSGMDEEGKALPKGRCVQLRDALFEAVADGFATDSTLVAYGEENRDWGGAFAVYRGLTELLPYNRLFNSPISEGAIVGSAVGYALEGGRVIAELMYCDFMGRAGDEIFNQLAKWQAMSGGRLRMPVVLRVSVGSKYGAQHSQDWTSMVAHVPGLKVVFPVTPYDAKGLLASALQGTDPVVFFESQRLYDQTELFHPGGVPSESYTIPLGEPDVKRAGGDLTILTIGATLYRALEAAEILSRDYGIEAEVIDARSIVPFNYDLVLESVRQTRRILLASDACERGSFLNTMAAEITRLAFDDLDGPPVVVGARNWITPPDELEDQYFPFAADMLDAIHQFIRPLAGYKPSKVTGPQEVLRRNRQGV